MLVVFVWVFSPWRFFPHSEGFCSVGFSPGLCRAITDLNQSRIVCAIVWLSAFNSVCIVDVFCDCTFTFCVLLYATFQLLCVYFCVAISINFGTKSENSVCVCQALHPHTIFKNAWKCYCMPLCIHAFAEIQIVFWYESPNRESRAGIGSYFAH